MMASANGHNDIVRTLLEVGGDINAQNKVRNQMMIIIIIIILLTILMMMMLMCVASINLQN